VFRDKALRRLLTSLILCLSTAVHTQSAQGLINEEGEPNAGFGNNFAGNVNTIFAGVGSGDGHAKDAGYALVYETHDGRWHLMDGLLDEDGTAGDRFGWRVAMAGSTALVVPLQRHDDEMTRHQITQPRLPGTPAPARSGAILALGRDKDGWGRRQIIQPVERWNRGEFGYSIAIRG